MSSPFESFSCSLADVLFRDSPSGGVGPLVHDGLVARFAEWFNAADLAHLHIIAGYIDSTLIANLPGAQQLEVARIVQAKYPGLIPRMPILRERQNHLRRSSELAEVFMPSSLERLSAAIAKEIS